MAKRTLTTQMAKRTRTKGQTNNDLQRTTRKTKDQTTSVSGTL
jgi:hypothetical protein